MVRSYKKMKWKLASGSKAESFMKFELLEDLSGEI